VNARIGIEAFKKRTGWQVDDRNRNSELDDMDLVWRDSFKKEPVSIQTARDEFYSPKNIAKEYVSARDGFRKDVAAAKGRFRKRKEREEMRSAFDKLAGTLQGVNAEFAAQVTKYKDDADKNHPHSWTNELIELDAAVVKIEKKFAELLKP
jgi:hypothetical protein